MSMTDRLELRILKATRVVCLCALLIAILSMIAVMLSLALPAQANVAADPAVNASAVLASIPGSEAANDTDPIVQPTGFPGLELPPALSKAIDEDDALRDSLADWLSNVPAPYRQAFVNELSDVVARANAHAASWEWDNRERYVGAAMRQYARLKIEHIAAADIAIASANARSENLRMSIGTLLGIAGFLTLMLLLLAIELNTRGLRTGARP
jgi:hypothetical protein